MMWYTRVSRAAYSSMKMHSAHDTIESPHVERKVFVDDTELVHMFRLESSTATDDEVVDRRRMKTRSWSRRLETIKKIVTEHDFNLFLRCARLTRKTNFDRVKINKYSSTQQIIADVFFLFCVFIYFHSDWLRLHFVCAHFTRFYWNCFHWHSAKERMVFLFHFFLFTWWWRESHCNRRLTAMLRLLLFCCLFRCRSQSLSSKWDFHWKIVMPFRRNRNKFERNKDNNRSSLINS